MMAASGNSRRARENRETTHMREVRSPGRRLRDAIDVGPVLLPGVFNALVGRMAEQLGFSAVYLSGAALSACMALPDVGLVSLPEFVATAQTITQATTLPLVCDADTGFGEALNVERTVRLFESAGVAGIHLEDQELPKRCGHLSGKTLIEPDEMAGKIRAAVAAKRDADFFVIARTDARGVNGFSDAVSRAHLYKQAGADAIFPEALESAEEFGRFAKEVPGPLLANMTEFGKSPLLDARQLGDLGYRLILFPVTTLRVALLAAESVLREIKEKGSQEARLPSMMTRAHLYDLLGYAGYEERDRIYFGGADLGRHG
jgi:methylisocitrate lyase